MSSIAATIAAELTVNVRQVEAAVRLLDEGATVPFVARYRKEATGGLDDTQLRTLEKRLASLRDLEQRRATILKSLAEQGVLTPALEAAVAAADTATRLEDLYRPFRPKRRTKAQVAREAGLAPLAARLLANPDLSPEQAAAAFVDAAARRARRRERPRRRAADPDRGLRRRRRAGRPPARASVGARRPRLARRARQGAGGREILRLLRRQRSAAPGAVASRPRDVPRPRRVDPAPGAGAEGGRRSRGGRADRLRADDRRPLQDPRARSRRRRLAGGYRARRVAQQAGGASRNRPARPAARAGRDRGDRGLRQQPARSAAGGAGRTAGDDGTRPGPAHGREGRGGRCHRQAGRDRDDLSARAAQRLGRRDRHARSPRRRARGGAGQHRQRHRLARNRPPRRRPRETAPGSAPDEGDGERGRAPRCTRPPSWEPRNFPTSTSRSAARSRSPADCRIRSPSW